ncbi:hypothetical protein LTR62_005349 [Meristemomyces frigidus]|uniref:C2H2-type domain-containing protein n=1 Tax=Meristemomyces frigidus TaxID=1508187 RepID=A0AAN7YFH0_9PEZI|nr:hypothetical protein LTR62_005349 [Meristemomyces frigidus]
MASEDNTDFPLFPYPDLWNQEQAYMPTTTFGDQQYTLAPTFDSMPAQPSYAQMGLGTFAYDNATSFDPSKSTLYPPSPTYSPTNSASHSFDYQNPPVLSTTSDSVSVQSNMSSGMNSPSAHPQYSAGWSHQATINSAHSIHESLGQGTFEPPTFDYESMLPGGKECVGEFHDVSFSYAKQPAPAMSSFPFLSSLDLSRLGDNRQDSPFPPQHSRYGFATPEASTGYNTAFANSPGVTTASASEPTFKSPAASAATKATSPVLERVKGIRQASVAPPTYKPPRGASPLSTIVTAEGTDWPPRSQASSPTLNSPFFFQSNPSLIQSSFSPAQFSGAQFAESVPVQSPRLMPHSQAHSPADFKRGAVSPRASNGKAPSPYVRTQGWQPYPTGLPTSRRQSVCSEQSRHSQGSISSSEDSNKGLCPITSCGRHVKDLKAHMLTHQNERPEKCPMATCDYHTKGFARKYDKNRHTLTHYKGTMVCGFCPGSGSAAEKSFNRADVFKRHLTSVHGVEQTPPNARKRSPAASTARKSALGVRETPGMCSTCGVTFPSAQDFYEHLDDCVLRVVQQAEPSEAINEHLLSSVAEDQDVQSTMERHSLSTDFDASGPTSFGEDEVAEEEEDEDDNTQDGTYGALSTRAGKSATKLRKSAAGAASAGTYLTAAGAIGKPRGLTRSQNGVPLSGPQAAKSNKRRKNFPLSWGAAPEKMKMRKRVLCVYDGQRRLWKDDMMLDADHEVRVPLPGASGNERAWITDLDVMTLRRADGLFGATEEERGPWVEEEELERLMQ